MNFSTQNWNGSFSFGTKDNLWAFSANGTLNNTGFSGEVTNTTSTSIAKNIQGDISGKFYGKNAEVLLGNGELTSDKGSASMSFGAIK